MDYKFRILFYYLNVFVIAVTIIGIILAIIMMFMHPNDSFNWFVAALICLLILVLLMVIYLIRKNKFPAPGKDYY